MTKDQAVDILIKAVEAATKQGAFTLQDAGVIAQAVAVIRTPEPAPKKEETPEPEKTTK